jgi:hypothetical protein
MSPRATSGASAPPARGSSRGTRYWLAAAAVGVVGGLANYLLAASQVGAATPPGIRDAALLAARIDLGCWVLLGLLWLAFLGPLHAGRGWARVALTVTAGVAVILDLMNLVGSWASVVSALAQLALLAAALVSLYRRGRSAR